MSLARRSSRSTSRLPTALPGTSSSQISSIMSTSAPCPSDEITTHEKPTPPDLVTLEDTEHDEYTSPHSSTSRPNPAPSAFPSSSPVSAQSELDSDREITYEELKFPVPAPPKHIPFPDVPQNSELLNELVMFVYTSLAASMQFLHLYRTVWWLPESHSSHALVTTLASLIQFDRIQIFNFFFFLQNFYLIDMSLVVFIVSLLSRRLFYCLLARIIHFLCPKIFIRFTLSFLRWVTQGWS